MSTRLLFFEDFENNILEILTPYFKKSGFEVQHVTTVSACLDAVRTMPPAVVVMITNNIREKPAFEVAKSIQLLHSTCGFVFLAGSDSDGREAFLNAGYGFSIRSIPLPLPELLSLVIKAVDEPGNTFVRPK